MTRGSINYKRLTQGRRWALNHLPPPQFQGLEIFVFDCITTYMYNFYGPQLAMFTPFVLRLTLTKTHTFYTEAH